MFEDVDEYIPSFSCSHVHKRALWGLFFLILSFKSAFQVLSTGF